MKIFIQMMLVCNLFLVAGSIEESAFAEEKDLSHAPRFTVPSTLIIPSGSFALRWTIPDDPISHQFELQEGTRWNFSSAQIIYSGPDRGTYISGLPNGNYFYRVRAVNAQESKNGQWSSTIHRTVEHPSMEFTLSLMTVGAMVFLSTIGMIALGIQREKR